MMPAVQVVIVATKATSVAEAVAAGGGGSGCHHVEGGVGEGERRR